MQRIMTKECEVSVTKTRGSVYNVSLLCCMKAITIPTIIPTVIISPSLLTILLTPQTLTLISSSTPSLPRSSSLQVTNSAEDKYKLKESQSALHFKTPQIANTRGVPRQFSLQSTLQLPHRPNTASKWNGESVNLSLLVCLSLSLSLRVYVCLCLFIYLCSVSLSLSFSCYPLCKRSSGKIWLSTTGI